MIINNRIIFISNTVYPTANAGGGSVVVYRHLKRFKELGYEIIIINTLLKSSYNSEFSEINLNKKWWYPPVRKSTPFFTYLRIILYYLTINKRIEINKTDIVFSILGEYLNLLALEVSRKKILPLYFFYHDDSLFNKYKNDSILSNRQINNLLNGSKCIFAVSKPMVELLKSKGVKIVKLLYPIPQGNLNIKAINRLENKNLKFTLAFSGGIFEQFQFPILKIIAKSLEVINGNFMIISNYGSPDRISSLNDNISTLPWQNNISDLFSYFAKHVDVLLIFYSFDEDLEPRMKTSFPSKFCEYVHLGIPILIIASDESAIGVWAMENNWKAFVNSSSPYALQMEFIKLQNVNYRQECIEQCVFFADSQFNPDKIHNELLESIM